MISNAPISDWQFKEIISPTVIGVRRAAIQLSVPAYLPERRIYLYLEVKQSAAAEYFFGCNIIASRRGNIGGIFPASICDFTGVTPNQSVASVFNAGGSPVGDSLVVRLAQPFDSTVPSVVVQPLRINAECDELTLDILSVQGATLTGFRAFLGCLSTKY